VPIRNYGLKWKFDAGMTGEAGGDPIDLSAQLGIYLIHRGEKIVYVGKSAKGKTAGIYGRLIGHKHEGMRFSTYSWFGVLPVNNAMSIDFLAAPLTTAELITNLEALLIYLLNPTSNGNFGEFKKMTRYEQCARVKASRVLRAPA